MTQDEIIEMAIKAHYESKTWIDIYKDEITAGTVRGYLEAFAKLVEEHVRNTMNDEAKAHLEELRKNFNAESAELRLHMWSKEKQEA
jgi:hypothetical protein